MALIRGTVESFNAGAYTAVVRPDGSALGVLGDVRVSRAIASSEMTAGRRALVETDVEGDSAEVVVIAVYPI